MRRTVDRVSDLRGESTVSAVCFSLTFVARAMPYAVCRWRMSPCVLP